MAARFIGQYEHTLDDKGRVVLPAKLRDRVNPDIDGDGFVVTPGPELCLFLYTDNEWERICDEQEALPAGDAELRQFQRQWYANAEPISVDKQGRILLSERQRSLVSIEKEIVFRRLPQPHRGVGSGTVGREPGGSKKPFLESGGQLLGWHVASAVEPRS